MNSQPTVLNQYTKALRVVESSETSKHLEAANRFVNLFIKNNSEIDKKGNLVPSNLVAGMYTELNKQLKLKENAVTL